MSGYNPGRADIQVEVGGPSASVTAGTLAATTTAQALGSSTSASEVLVQNDPNNGSDILVGSSAAQPLRLQPGQTLAIPAANVNLLWVKTASGTATVNWIARS